MEYSSVESEYLVSLLSSAINEKPLPQAPANIDWVQLVELSKKQQVYSIIASLLSGAALPQEQAQELNVYNQNELLRLLAMKSEFEALEKELAEKQIKFMMLKGSVLREYYPQQKMRQMSDIDLLYDYSKRESLLEIMNKRGFDLISWSENSDDFTKKPFYTFEFHHELFFNSLGFCPDFSNVWDNAVCDKNNAYKYHMSREDLYLHTITHMYKHFTMGGFGVRFLCDVYLFLKKEQSNLDWKYVNARLAEFSLTDFEAVMRKISFDLFEGRVPDDKQLDIINTIFKYGIYGNADVGIEMYFEKFKEEHDGKFVLFRYYLSKLFPNKEFMKRNYTVLESKPYLLPLYYVIRIFNKLTSNRDYIRKSYKHLKQKNKKDKTNGG